MDKLERIIKRIRADLERVGKLTGKNHISAFIVDDFYHFTAINGDYEADNNPINFTEIGGKQ